MNVQIQIQTHASLDSRKFSLAFSFFLFNFFFRWLWQLWLMCAHTKGCFGTMGACFPRNPFNGRKQTFYVWLRATFGSALHSALLRQNTNLRIFALYTNTRTQTHPYTDTHTQRQEPRQRSHAHTSIFYHNFDAARLINLFAENIFTSFIRKNRRPTHHSSTHSFHAIGEMHFHQLLTISVFFFVVFFVFSRPTPEAICIWNCSWLFSILVNYLGKAASVRPFMR